MLLDKGYLTPKEVAGLLMVSTSSIRLWSEKGDLQAMVTAGGHRRFRLSNIQEFALAHNIELDIFKNESVKVLIVDDEQIFCEYLQDVIESKFEQVVVKISLDGFDAGVQLREFRPNFVLMVATMPGFDGLRVCRLIRNDPQLNDVQVIVMAKEHSVQVEKMLVSAGADACISKPIDINNLFQLLDLKQSC